MAMYENISYSKCKIDDTEKLLCTVENAQNINKYTEYTLRIQKGPMKDNKWNVSRRYRDFSALHAILQQANIHLPLPPKKLIGNMQPSFIAERQIGLQNYINEVLKHQILALSLHVRCFLDPSNYSPSIAEQALQAVSIALRGDGRYELKGSLTDIGWRIRKQYFLVTDSNSKANYLLSWQSYGVDRCLCDKDLQIACRSLQNLSHPYIDQILAINNLESGAYVVRRIHENGSLRDILYGTEYSKNYLTKYGNPKVRKPFTYGQIAHYGFQILQALNFLHQKSLPHGHLHTGNIAIVDHRAVLLDIENFILGAVCIHRPYLLDLRRTATIEAVDVYCFGRVVYEMVFAAPLEQYYCDHYPDVHDRDIESVLQLCLSSTSCKHGGPTIEHLLQHPFFTNARVNGLRTLPREEIRMHLKFPLPLKEELKAAVSSIEARLKNDQKMVRSAKREVRIREILSSEEELKKQKRRAKKRDSIWKSTSSLAETVRSSLSTASSPTPPVCSTDVSGNGSCSASAASPCDGRSALLNAICAFDKTKLARVASR